MSCVIIICCSYYCVSPLTSFVSINIPAIFIVINTYFMNDVDNDFFGLCACAGVAWYAFSCGVYARAVFSFVLHISISGMIRRF